MTGSLCRVALGAALVLAVAGSGCGVDFGDPGTNGTSSAYSPRITSSFPEAGAQTLVEGGSLTFSAAGSDDDSLELSWDWSLDGSIQALGSEDDGNFETSWQLSWDSAWSGATLVVDFRVSDGDHSATLNWPVDVP